MAYPGDEPDNLAGAAGDEDEFLEAEEQLLLADDDERLPWLESDDDYEEGGFDWRLIKWAVLGFVVIAVLLGLLWYFTQGEEQPEVVPDGSTIEAPEGPFKVRPDDPGGREVDGTGDVSFGVGQGQDVESRLGGEDTPRPSIDREQADAPAPAPSSTSGVGIQVGAYSSREIAEKGWGEVSRRYSALSGLSHRIIEAQIDGARVYRLQAVAGSEDAAQEVCRSIRASGGDCQVKR